MRKEWFVDTYSHGELQGNLDALSKQGWTIYKIMNINIFSDTDYPTCTVVCFKETENEQT